MTWRRLRVGRGPMVVRSLLLSASGVLALGLSIGCQPVPKAGDGKTDGPTPRAAAETSSGARLYGQHCAVCHGPKGKGDGLAGLQPPPADLTSPRAATQLAPQLIKTVHEGRANTAMGAWRQLLSEQDIEDVVAYLRQLRE